MNYCATHEGEIEPCRVCAAIERNKKLRGEIAEAKAAMPPGMLDGPGNAPTPIVAVEVPEKTYTVGHTSTSNPNAPIPADPLVLRAQAFVDAQKAEKNIEDHIEELRNSVKSIEIALEQARERTILAKQMLTTTLETP